MNGTVVEASTVSTPCVKECVIGADGLCRGCGRSLQEIVDWSRMAEPQRRAVMAALPARRRSTMAVAR
jgi:predicted Fe-S protein YdhL (DUF1289 family)